MQEKTRYIIRTIFFIFGSCAILPSHILPIAVAGDLKAAGTHLRTEISGASRWKHSKCGPSELPIRATSYHGSPNLTKEGSFIKNANGECICSMSQGLGSWTSQRIHSDSPWKILIIVLSKYDMLYKETDFETLIKEEAFPQSLIGGVCDFGNPFPDAEPSQRKNIMVNRRQDKTKIKSSTPGQERTQLD